MSYADRQGLLDAEYLAAWDDMPEEARAALAEAGIRGPCLDREAPEGGRMVITKHGDAAELYQGRLATRVDFAAAVDQLADQISERWKLERRIVVELASFIEARVREAEAQRHSAVLARVVGFFLTSSENVRARAHGLAHACRMAGTNGFPSLRSSARECGVSVEWLRRVAWKWCDLLDLPPLEGAKTAEAREKYSQVQQTNHWRTKKCQPPQK